MTMILYSMVWHPKFEVDGNVYIDNMYDCMVTKNECELIWKIMHVTIMANWMI